MAFTPEMASMAADMMKNMKPEDMARMAEMASKMGMGGPGMGMAGMGAAGAGGGQPSMSDMAGMMDNMDPAMIDNMFNMLQVGGLAMLCCAVGVGAELSAVQEATVQHAAGGRSTCAVLPLPGLGLASGWLLRCCCLAGRLVCCLHMASTHTFTASADLAHSPAPAHSNCNLHIVHFNDTIFSEPVGGKQRQASSSAV